jgi:hypothetical protein
MTALLHEVHLRGIPLALLAESSERNEELMRELALIANPHPDSDNNVPRRLLRLVQRLREDYSDFRAGPQEQIDEARARGEATIDVTYHVPVTVGPAAAELRDLLDDTDEYCRSGDLLTLASPELLVRFRRWYLGEFVRQIAGQEPQPWEGPLTLPE